MILSGYFCIMQEQRQDQRNLGGSNTVKYSSVKSVLDLNFRQKFPLTMANASTHWGVNEMADILQKTFSNAFLEWRLSSIQISLNCALKGPIDSKKELIQVLDWCHKAPSHYLNQCWLRSMMHYPVTRPQYANNDSETVINIYLHII